MNMEEAYGRLEWEFIRNARIAIGFPKGLTRTHLSFADDNLIFCRAEESEAKTLINILDTILIRKPHAKKTTSTGQ